VDKSGGSLGEQQTVNVQGERNEEGRAGEVAGVVDVDMKVTEGIMSRMRHCLTVMLWIIT